MFEKLFKCSKTVTKYRTAPLLEERLRFLEHQAGLELSPVTLRLAARYLLVVAATTTTSLTMGNYVVLKQSIRDSDGDKH